MKKEKNKFYVTAAIAYVNNRPHIGHAMEALQADAVARYRRLKNDEVFYLSGADEHGTKVANTAKEAGKEPQALVDENTKLFQELLSTLNISNDSFIRTTSPDHTKASQKLWKEVEKRNPDDIYQATYTGYYCVGCEAYVTEKELINGKCPIHDQEPEKVDEKDWFFRLSKYQDQIKKAIESDEFRIIPETRKNEALGIIKEGLRDISISRPKEKLSWGVEVPDDPDHVMYVWFDALSNYISGIGYASNEAKFKKLWPADVHVIGKDILRFHSLIWPGMLLAAGLKLPKQLYVHGWIHVKGEKISKSKGNIVDPFELVKTYGVDPVRYYLLREIPAYTDGDFSIKRFEELYTSELANGIGNLVSRVTTLIDKDFAGQLPVSDLSKKVAAEHNKTQAGYENSLDVFLFNNAIGEVQKLVSFCDAYIERNRPWEIVKVDKEKAQQVLFDLAKSIRLIGKYLEPFIPDTASKINEALQVKSDKVLAKKISPLFPRLEK